MKMIDVVLILFLVLIIGGAVLYVVRARKNGVKCIGCPASGSCSRNCGCHADTDE